MPLKKIKFLTFFLTFLGLIEFPLLSMADPPVIPPTTLPELRPPSAAGQILQDIDRGQLKRPSQSPRGTEPAEPGQANQEAKTIVIKRFKFVGNTLLSDDALTLLLNSLLIEPISISELKNAVNLITESYRTRGYLVSVSIPEQDITEGVLTLKIIESKLGKVKIDGAYKKDFFRVNPSIIKSFSETYLTQDESINLNDLNRGLSNTNELPGIKVSSSLQAGDKEGFTDVILNIKDKPVYRATVSSDNSGSRSIGRNRYQVSADLLSPLHIGDDLNFLGLHTLGSDFGKLSYEVPLNNRGLRAAVSYSRLEYNVILDGFKKTPQGSSDTRGVNFSYSILNNTQSHLKAYADYTSKNFLNQYGTQTTSEYDINVNSFSVSGDHNDQFLFLGGVTSFNYSYLDGNVNLAATPVDARINDAETYQTAGEFKKFKWSLNRTQFIQDTLLLNVLFTGQLANKNLDSSEKFYLGGMNGVRAYPTNEGGGSQGFMINTELMKYLPYDFSVSGFVDYGRVMQNVDNHYHIPNWPAGLAIPKLAKDNFYSLSGYGASVAWQGPYRTNIKATWAHRMGANPDPGKFGTDQDGTKIINTVWLNASISF